MARTPVPTTEQYQAAWSAALAPHVRQPIEAVALLNPAGAVAGQAAAVAGRSVGGLLGRLAARKVAQATVGRPADGRPVPAVLAAALTADGIHLFEVEAEGDADRLTVLGHWDSWERRAVRLSVARKVMSERLTFTLADGRVVELDGMFAPRSKDRQYQRFIDLVGTAA